MLTDTEVRKLPNPEKPRKLSDSGGLYLYATPAGGRIWRLKYRFDGKEKLLVLGHYPRLSLRRARELRDEARAHLSHGRDPSIVRGEAQDAEKERAAGTFEAVAREWYGLQKSRWTEVHAAQVIGSLEAFVFPELGADPIGDISAADVLRVVRAIEARPAIETARRVRQRMSAVFVHGIATGRGQVDPAAIIKPALAPLIKGRQPAITDLKEVRQILKDAEGHPAHAVTRLALRFLALTVVRPGVLRTTPWSEFAAMTDNVWVIPAERMKMRREFLVPLSQQARDTLLAVHKLTGGGPLLFPNSRNAHKPMSENAIGYLLNRAGYHSRHVPHGWRSAFSTIMNERFRGDREIIDMMLAHGSDDPVEAAYNRSAYLDRRRELAQIWADLLLEGFCVPEDLLTLCQKGSYASDRRGQG
ncbi:tyrosine-type recombinase/integrase [Acidisoma sp. 7E03]